MYLHTRVKLAVYICTFNLIAHKTLSVKVNVETFNSSFSSIPFCKHTISVTAMGNTPGGMTRFMICDKAYHSKCSFNCHNADSCFLIIEYSITRVQSVKNVCNEVFQIARLLKGGWRLVI